jgi:hypothetical protein
VSIALGGAIAVGNAIEVVRGETFDGVVIGLAGAFFAILLLLGGVGTWQVRPFGRRTSLAAAVGTLVVNGLAVILFGFPFGYLVLGAIYPVVLLLTYNLPTWKMVFGDEPAGVAL